MQLFSTFYNVPSPLSPHIQLLCLTDGPACVYADVSKTLQESLFYSHFQVNLALSPQQRS